MDSQLLDTLVKLASLGTSGICICAIASIGWILKDLPDGSSEQRHISLRYYMKTCMIIAFISGISGTANAVINAGKISILEGEKIAVEDELAKQENIVATYKVQVAESNGLVEGLHSLLDSKQAEATLYGSPVISEQLKILRNTADSLKAKLANLDTRS